MGSYHTSVKSRVRTLMREARKRAIKKGILFTLTDEWMLAKIDIGYCEATGIHFELYKDYTQRFHNPFAPSLDRINPNGPYTPENTQVVLSCYNRAKSDMTPEELRMLAMAILHPHR